MDYGHGGLMQSCTMRRSATVSRAAANVKKAPAQAGGKRAARHATTTSLGSDKKPAERRHYARLCLEYLTLEMLAYGRQKPAYSHFMARIFRKILAEHLTHFIRKLI